MGRKTLDRRDFLKMSAVGLAGGYAALHGAEAWARGGMMGGGGGGSTTTIIDPPPGALFEDPPVLANESALPGEMQVTITAQAGPVSIAGVTANLLTYNGSYPAPTIVAKRGDRLKIKLVNSLSMLGTNILGHDRDITNLHTHGLHVSPSGNADNMMTMVMSGDTFDYEYDLALQDPGSINFYHPHVHGSVAEQYWGGMAGALEIEDGISALAGYDRHLLFLKDITLSGSAPAPYTSRQEYMHGKEGNLVLVNGQVNPVLPIRPGQVQRWRIINASNARFYLLQLEGHTLYVVGTEGGPLDRPYAMSSLLLSPGERVDVLVRANQTAKSYRLLSLPYSRGGMSTPAQVTLMTMPYQGGRTSDVLPGTVNPAAVRISPPISKTEQLTLGMGMGKGYINGISFEMLSDGKMLAAEVCSKLGTYEIWEVINPTGMDHPFHQHVNPCQVLSISGGNAAYNALYTTAPAWKDVVLIPKMGRARLLIPVADYDGMAMFHCHIVEHEDIGMMGVWHIGMGGMGGMCGM